MQWAAGSVWVRAFFTVMLVALIATFVDWGAAVDQLQGWLVAAIPVPPSGFCSAAQLVAAWRWFFLLEGAGLGRARCRR